MTTSRTWDKIRKNFDSTLDDSQQFYCRFPAKVTRFKRVFGICNTTVLEHDFSATAAYITMVI